MERGKTKLSWICVSLIIIMSMLLAIFGVMSLNKSSDSNADLNNGTEQGTQVVAGYHADTYMGGVKDNYIQDKNYALMANWKAISTEQNLKDFLNRTGNYSSGNGYLTKNISLNWNNSRANLSPNIVFSGAILDGCGFTISLEGEFASGNLDTRNDSQRGMIIGNTDKITDQGHAAVNNNIKFIDYSRSNNYVTYQIFGGLLTGMENDAILQNFTFKINSSHNFTYIDSSNNDYCDKGDWTHTVLGGLVGYNNGGTIDNVVVELAAGKTFGVSQNNNSNPINAWFTTQTVYEGLVVGVSKGGKLTNVASRLQNNSQLISTNSSGWRRKWNETSPSEQPGASLVGGIAGRITDSCQLDKATFIGNGGRIIANVDTIGYSTTTGGSGGPFGYYRKAAGIVAVNSNCSIGATMVTGTLNCMIAGGTSGGGDSTKDEHKSLYVTEGNKPTTMIYKNGTGGDNTEGSKSDVAYGYDAVDGRAKVNTTYQGVEVPYFFNRDDESSQIKLFIPEGRVLWTLYGNAVFSQLIRGEYSASYPNESSDTEVSTGISGSGEIGFYKQVNGNWVEMSDGYRPSGQETLYYDGTTYKVLMKINDGGRDVYYERGMKVRNIGDLKNAMNGFNGRPVSLYCDDGMDAETAVAYSDDQERVVVLKKDTTGLDKTLSITQRTLYALVSNNYNRGVSTIFSGVTVRFVDNSVAKDPNNGTAGTGLADNDYIMWQDTSYVKGVQIALNVAGHQLLRPSTNNYRILQSRMYNGKTYWDEIGGYFSALILPHTIEVADGIYINGSAVTDNKYEIKNNVDYGNADKNASKRTIKIAARLNDNHFVADAIRLVDNAGSEIKVDWSSEGNLTTATYTVSNANIAKIEFVNRKDRRYIVSINGVPNVCEFGQKIELHAEPKEGEEFIGWRRANGEYLTYLPDYSFKVSDVFTWIDSNTSSGPTRSMILTAVYEPVNAEEIYTHRYFDTNGQLVRECKNAGKTAIIGYTLPNSLGYRFNSWSKVSEVDNIITFKATYTQSDSNAPMVDVVWNNSSVSEQVAYGTPIELAANTTWVVNDAIVDVGETPYTIYAITDLTIEKYNALITPVEKSMAYNAFKYGELYYLSITFVYGEKDAVYDGNNKPAMELLNFVSDDITQYVRNGNLYQISVVMTEQEVECRFGPDPEIATFLTIDGYQFDEVIVLLEK